MRPYDLRHTRATLLLVQWANVKLVSEQLGDECMQVTLRHGVRGVPAMPEQAAEGG